MARARVKHGRKLADITQAIVAEWYRVLPDAQGEEILPMDEYALTAAFNAILDQDCVAVLDAKDGPIHIAVPFPPSNVDTRDKLMIYLDKNHDFWEGMGAAVLFGCGR
jgi:hypothetical protein